MKRDMWAELTSAFAEAFAAHFPALSDDDLERMREEYERGEIASAQSEAAEVAAQQEFRK